ncbi:MAG: GspE/PulE family protein [Patescibacteria group bacterium]
MALTKEQLYEALVDGGVVSKEDFKAAAASRDVKRRGIDGVLISRGKITDEQAGQMVANWMGVPFINLRQQEITNEALKLIPESFARTQLILPVAKRENVIKIATTDPQNVFLRALLEKYLREEINLVYATSQDIEDSLFLFQKEPSLVIKSILEYVKGSEEEESKIIDLVNSFFELAYQGRASDVHIEPEDDYVVIRFRVDGMLHDISEIPKEFHDSIISRLKVLARLAIDEHRAAQDGKIRYRSTWGEFVEIRLSIVPTTHGEKAVMRLLSAKAREYNLSDLGLSDRDLVIFQQAIKKPWGMILVTGPTGSGKTTTLYAALKVLNKRNVNISTIEDPVEYDIEGINQIQVNPKTSLTFAKGLRSVVRQDPDIIMVGEIRDGETADISVNAAMTGHLVLSTLHTNDAATAFPRIQDMGVEDFLIASTVVSVIAQRLVRRICLRCIQSEPATKQELVAIKKSEKLEKYFKEITGKKTLNNLRLFHGAGCKVCNGTGYLGRTGIFEILSVSDSVREALMADHNADEIHDIAIKEGMKSMLYDGVEKVSLGLTTLSEVMRVTQE